MKVNNGMVMEMESDCVHEFQYGENHLTNRTVVPNDC